MDSKKCSTLKERFLRYVKFNTRSDEASETIPSTPSQMEFAKMLKKELEELGLSNVFIILIFQVYIAKNKNFIV